MRYFRYIKAIGLIYLSGFCWNVFANDEIDMAFKDTPLSAKPDEIILCRDVINNAFDDADGGYNALVVTSSAVEYDYVTRTYVSLYRP